MKNEPYGWRCTLLMSKPSFFYFSKKYFNWTMMSWKDGEEFWASNIESSESFPVSSFSQKFNIIAISYSFMPREFAFRTTYFSKILKNSILVKSANSTCILWSSYFLILFHRSACCPSLSAAFSLPNLWRSWYPPNICLLIYGYFCSAISWYISNYLSLPPFGSCTK